MIHDNTMEAWWTFDMDGRQLEVCGLLAKVGEPLTDREVCYRLGSEDMNYARPAITHLVQAGHLIEADDVVCAVTGRTVRRVWFAPTKPEKVKA